ncbi:hypothetical protein N658DRAFT_54572 [Parathielavia hyrcaniae]|uniref:Uncharacterized protein n=1 Tax=Parathielavia hyrcaniae TaxID=113614 RepID=A0AAN6Q1J6_9PEZI|nr:hypothetical protein N658DRAFT_54572 [Parathielavia hyrcaniae]
MSCCGSGTTPAVLLLSAPSRLSRTPTVFNTNKVGYLQAMSSLGGPPRAPFGPVMAVGQAPKSRARLTLGRGVIHKTSSTFPTRLAGCWSYTGQCSTLDHRMRIPTRLAARLDSEA